MADSKKIKELDIKLMEENILDPAFKAEYQKVHTKMNSVIKKTGKILNDEIFKKGEDELREWLMLLFKKGASQEKLTSYLRCGLAHLSFDYIESSYKQIDKSDLITRVLQSLKKRRFNKTFFKIAASKISPKTKKTKNIKKAVKKKSVKKSSVKKTTKKVKKVTKKKTTKKAVAKKSAPKKAAAKKTTAKKAAPKKAAAKRAVTKKATPKKAAAKRTVTKKSAPKKVAAKKTTAKKSAPKKTAAKKSAIKKTNVNQPVSKKTEPENAISKIKKGILGFLKK